jgi:PPP family 3-phenylpropionic acid transporter
VLAVRSTKAQFFLSFAVLGAFFPYLPVYLREQSLSDTQIGWVFAASCIPNLLSPFIMTLLADTRLNARRLLAWLFVLAGFAMGLLFCARGFWAILLAYVLHRVMFAGILPLQDGLNFTLQELRKQRGLDPEPYHRVRIWGSIGYMVPSFALYFLMARGYATSISLIIAIAVCGLGAANLLLFLPTLPNPPAAADQPRLPSLDAMRVLARPPLRVFCIAMFILWLGITAWATFYPIYLKELGVQVKWLGPVSSLSIVVEIAFTAGFGWIVARMGLRRVMLLGVGAAIVRLFLLAAVKNPAVAIAVQIFHGPWVLALFVAPPSFINRNAGDRFRHSLQGVYAMLISGAAVLVGNLLCGWVKDTRGTAALFYGASACALVAMILLWVAFHEEHREA